MEDKRKVIYYSDLLNDDFAGNNIKTCHIPADFQYVHKSLIWRISSFILYYIIALPLIWIMAKVWLGVKFENRQVIKKLHGTGFFLYGNHTQVLDAYIPALAAFPKRSYIIANAYAVSIPGIKNIVMMLGALPIPSEFAGFRRFMDAIAVHKNQNACIAIYPEAHIWPFYTGVRPFPDTSFRYPVITGAPVIAMITTYRKRKGLFAFCKRPGMTVTFSEVIPVDYSLTQRQAQAELRQKAFEFMDSVARSKNQVTYIRYERKQEYEKSK